MTTRFSTQMIMMMMALETGACGGVPSEETGEQGLDLSSGPTLLAYSSPSGLVSSTGNLYWTSSAIDEFGPDSATVWRASKSNTPGSEVALYTESGDRTGAYFFGSIVWALEDTYYGYFSANYNDNGQPTSQIKRVPLAGGPATVLADSPAYIGIRDIVTDASSLYWADAGGIRKLSLTANVNPFPIGVGAKVAVRRIAPGVVVTLAATTTTSHVGLDANYVYFEQGATIQRVPKSGGAVSTVVAAAANVTAFYVDPSTEYIYWGEQGGGIRRQPASGGSTFTYQLPMVGHDAISVGFDGTRILWIDCTEPGNGTCYVRAYLGGGNVLTTNIGSYSVGSAHLQWDSTSVYWGDASGLKKYVY